MYVLPAITTTAQTGRNNAKPADPADESSADGTNNNSKTVDLAEKPKMKLTTTDWIGEMMLSSASHVCIKSCVVILLSLLLWV